MNAEKCDYSRIHSFSSQRSSRWLGHTPVAEWDVGLRKHIDASREKVVGVGVIKPRSGLGELLSLGTLGNLGGKRHLTWAS